jgi:hypothetical protein
MVVYRLFYIVVVVLCLLLLCCCTMGVLLLSYLHLLYYVRIAVVTLLVVAGLLARSQYSEVPATSHLDTGFLGFPVSISECWDGSQDSKLPLHASHVALPT